MNNKILFILAFPLICAATIPANAALYINEVVASNATFKVDGQYPDWIELYNDADTAMNISGFGITDKKKQPFKYRLPDNTFIEANGYLVLFADGRGEGLHLNFNISADGETLTITDPSKRKVDALSTPTLLQDISYGRSPDGSNNKVRLSVPSPGSANITSSELTEPPVLSVQSGFYNDSVKVSIKAESGDEIRYTLNGKTPDSTSLLYTEPLVFRKTTVLRATTLKKGCTSSTPSSAVYFFDIRDHALPILSIVTDSANFFSDSIGIYVKGKNGITGNCSTEPVNWNQDWERPVWIDYFGTDKELLLSQNAGIKIHGECSRIYNKKSLKLLSTKEYSVNWFKNVFFNDNKASEFRSLILRSSGQDSNRSMLRDGLTSTICSDMAFEKQSFRPAIVYLDGEYWGIFNIRNQINEHYLESITGVDKDSIDILAFDYGVINGDGSDYRIFFDGFLKNKASLANNTTFNVIKKYINVHKYIDYIIAETFVSNNDWPGNNCKFWRVRDKIPFEWYLFDTDISYTFYNYQTASNPYIFDDHLLTFTDSYPNQEWSNRIFRRCITNQGFLNEFTQRYAYHLSTTFSETRTSAILDSLSNMIKNEIPYDLTHWKNGSADAWNSEISTIATYLNERPRYMRQFIQERFGAKGEYNTTIQIDPVYSGNESVDINLYGYDIEVPFNGIMFGGRPIQLEPVYDTSKYYVKYWTIHHIETGLIEQIRSDTLITTLSDDVNIMLSLEERTTDVRDWHNNSEYEKASFTVSPNPASDYIFIYGASNNCFYSIYNLTGELITSGSGNTIGVQDMVKGIYLLQITQNSSSSVFRFIIK